MKLQDLGNIYDALDKANPDEIHILVHCGHDHPGVIFTSNLHSNQGHDNTVQILRECLKQLEMQQAARNAGPTEH